MEKEKEVKMDSREKLILKQVSLKAAASVGGTKDEVVANATYFNNWLLEGLDLNKVSSSPTGTTSGGFVPTCPSCNSEVWDNRQTAKNNQPVWKCKNSDCTGGTFSKKYNQLMPWASWEDNEFFNAEQDYKKNANTVKEEAIVGEIIDNPMTDDTEDIVPF